jgi:uncharacterized repeat protein (TIGR03803 family)
MPIQKSTNTFSPASLSTIAFTILLLAASNAVAQSERILHSFANNGFGESPYTGLVLDAAGNLYGTTSSAGAYGQGTVFELSPKTGGGWTQKVLHNFGNGTDGQSPWGGSLLLDASGNLYGTTRYGGNGALCNSLNFVTCGTVFELSPNGDGSWTEKILFNFSGGSNGIATGGYHPSNGLVMDAQGNLYGTTFSGGSYQTTANGGTVFELSPSSTQEWSEKVLWNFGNGDDGNFPQCTLVFDKAGNLYGTTVTGRGTTAGGMVFELSPGTSGWTESILFGFDVDGDSQTGIGPQAGVVLDAEGNLYGTTAYGGPHFMGDVFELSPSAGGTWTETVLHTFAKGDGNTPDAGVILDSAGNLYGTTFMGGKANAGTVYELSRSSGTWTEKILHNFQAANGDGTSPLAGLVMDSKGYLYGTTTNGGVGAYGTVFQVKP